VIVFNEHSLRRHLRGPPQETAVPDLEDLPGESREEYGFRRFLHRADNPANRISEKDSSIDISRIGDRWAKAVRTPLAESSFYQHPDLEEHSYK
jgi:hypothetical protein